MKGRRPDIVFHPLRHRRLRERLAQIPGFAARDAVDPPPFHRGSALVSADLDAPEQRTGGDVGRLGPPRDRPYRARRQESGRTLPFLIALSARKLEQTRLGADIINYLAELYGGEAPA